MNYLGEAIILNDMFWIAVTMLLIGFSIGLFTGFETMRLFVKESKKFWENN